MLEVVQGFAGAWSSTLKNGGVALSYSSGDALDASVWAGLDAAPLFHPTVAWVSAPAGTFRLSVTAAQTVSLDPGTYRLQVGVTASGVRSVAYDGTLTVAPAPAAGTTRAPYCSADRLRFWYDQIPLLQNRKVDLEGFLGQRADASNEYDRELVVRYNPRPGFVRRRLNVMDPVVGLDVAVDSSLAPSKQDIDDAIAAGGVVPDYHVQKTIAYRAIADVLYRQESGNRGEYRDVADALRAEADRMFATRGVPLDLDADGVPDLLLCGPDVILLPPGTSP